MDLLTASHDELVALIEEQRAQIAALTATVARLEARLRDLEGGSGTPQRMPGHKATPASPPPPRPRRPRPSGFARRRSTPTTQVIHAIELCPTCQIPLAGGAVKRTREVLEVALTPLVVTEHVYLERCCGQCGRRQTPAADLAGIVVGQSRLGVGVVALIATLREEARLPYRAIQQLLRTLYGLDLSVGGLRGAVRQVARLARPAVAGIRERLSAGVVMQVDETGWREAGHNGYVWTVSGPAGCRFVYGGRDKGMLAEVLGPDPQGVLVSDFYAVSDGYAGVQQKCWAHLLRDVRDLAIREAPDAGSVAWAAAVAAVFRAAQQALAELAGEPAESVRRQAARRRVMTTLLAACQPYLPEQTERGRLCRRIAKQLDALFVFVLDPAVPATNNAAERSLRHLVVSRKISGGTRSRDGTEDKLTLASLFTSWRMQGVNPYLACRDLLLSPQV
jgi:transposase